MNELFSGTAYPFGGLSNEQKLVKLCPDEFKKSNKWSKLAMKLFYDGGSTHHWKYKNDDLKSKQFSCLKGLLGTFEIKHEDKAAIAGWMLSEMLDELPDYLPL